MPYIANVLNSPQVANIPVNFSIAASAPAGTVVAGSIAYNGTPTTNFTTPSNEVWYLLDFYVPSALATNLSLSLVVNNETQPFTIDTGAIIANTNGREHLSTPPNYDDAIVLLPNFLLNINGTLDTAFGSTAGTETVFMKVRRVPYYMYQQASGMSASGHVLSL